MRSRHLSGRPSYSKEREDLTGQRECFCAKQGRGAFFRESSEGGFSLSTSRAGLPACSRVKKRKVRQKAAQESYPRTGRSLLYVTARGKDSPTGREGILGLEQKKQPLPKEKKAVRGKKEGAGISTKGPACQEGWGRFIRAKLMDQASAREGNRTRSKRTRTKSFAANGAVMGNVDLSIPEREKGPMPEGQSVKVRYSWRREGKAVVKEGSCFTKIRTRP